MGDTGFDTESGQVTTATRAKSKFAFSDRVAGQRTDEPSWAPSISEPLTDEVWHELEEEVKERLPTPPERMTEQPSFLTASLKDLSIARQAVGFAQRFRKKPKKSKGESMESGEKAEDSQFHHFVENDALYLAGIQDKATGRIMGIATQAIQNFRRSAEAYPETISRDMYKDPSMYDTLKEQFEQERDVPRSDKTVTFADVDEHLRFDLDTFERAASTAAKDLASSMPEMVGTIINDMDKRTGQYAHERNFQDLPQKGKEWTRYTESRPDEKEKRVTIASVYPRLILDEDTDKPVKVFLEGTFVDQQNARTHNFASGTVSLAQPDTLETSAIAAAHKLATPCATDLTDTNSSTFAELWTQTTNALKKNAKKIFGQWDRNCKSAALQQPTTKGTDPASVNFAKSLASAKFAELSVSEDGKATLEG